jgi:transposase
MRSAALRILPATFDALYVGVDVGKKNHYAAFTNRELLAYHGAITKVPIFPFPQSRKGFESFLLAIGEWCPVDRCAVVLEVTGHYHLPLLLYLLEQGVAVYLLQTQIKSKHKSDARDAQMLANSLYNQQGLGVMMEETRQRIRPAAPISPLASYLRILIRHRTELTTEVTRRRNKLTAIADEVFPEFTEVCKDPNGIAALRIRQAFPTPELLAAASFDKLRKCSAGNKPSRANLARLQWLASQSIGTRDQGRLAGLVIIQDQVIRELHVLEASMSDLDERIRASIEGARERLILDSLGIISPLHQAVIIAYVGSIANYPDKAALKGFAGWHPRIQQSGETLDTTSIARSGNRALRQAIYLSTWHAVRSDGIWRELYERLHKRICTWDARKQRWRGRNKVLARLASQLLCVIYSLLKADYTLLQSVAAGDPLPEPQLYDRNKHASHMRRHGLKAL